MDRKKFQKNSGSGGGGLRTFLFICVIVGVLVAFSYMGKSGADEPKKLSSQDFFKKLERDEIKKVEFDKRTLCLRVTKQAHMLKKNEKRGGPHFLVKTGVRMSDFQKTYNAYLSSWQAAGTIKRLTDRPSLELKEPTLWNQIADFIISLLQPGLFLLLLLAFYTFGNPFDDRRWSKNKKGRFNKKNEVLTRLKDLQGMEEAKEQLADVIDFLKNPLKYTAMGAILPKGVLLSGPPGTGKTMLARAIAGECGVAFVSVAGSSFDEVYVGVGASRVRKLFSDARKNAPCIIFIDEIDSVAARRRAVEGGDMGGGDTNTLNQLLTEIDGFNASAGIFIIASTNRPNVLDPAILRPGRLGRRIYTNLPTIKERASCFRYYMEKTPKLSADISAEKLADLTPGASYAAISQLCNEARMIAARRNDEEVGMSHYNEAIDTFIGGTVIKEKILKGKQREIVAFHEAGHAVVSLHLPKADPLVRVTIIPRTMGALGFAQYQPEERLLHQKDHLLDRACALSGGPAAVMEEYGQVTTGAQNDFERIREILYDVVAFYGMNPKIGRLSYGSFRSRSWLRQSFSQKIEAEIDEEVRKLQDKLFKKAQSILKKHRGKLVALAKELLKKEVVTIAEVKRLWVAVDAQEQDKTLSVSAVDEKNPLATEKNELVP